MTKILTLLALIIVTKFVCAVDKYDAVFLDQSRVDSCSQVLSGEDFNEHSQFKPCCTFMIALAAIGINTAVLKDLNQVIHFETALKEEKTMTLSQWLSSQHTIPVAHVILNMIGADTVAAYVKSFKYGNCNTEFLEDPHAVQNGIYWLDGRLLITPQQQLDFLKLLLSGELDSPKEEKLNNDHFFDLLEGILKSQHNDITSKDNLKIVFGKTGAANFRDESNKELPHRFGWYVGWVKSAGCLFDLFVRLLAEKTCEQYDEWPSPVAKRLAIEQFTS